MLRTKQDTHHGRDLHTIPSAKSVGFTSSEEDFDPLQDSSSDDKGNSSDDGAPKSHDDFLKKADAKVDDEYSISWGHSERFKDSASSIERHRARTGSLFNKTFPHLSSPKPDISTPPPKTKPWSPFDSDSDEDNIKGDTTHAQSAPPTPIPGRSLLSGLFPKSVSSDPALPSSPLSTLSTSENTTPRSPLSSLSTLRDTSSPLSSNSMPTFSGMKSPGSPLTRS